MKGFSLIEIIIASCIFIILILAIFQTMDIGRSLWFTADVSTELRQEIIKAFTIMERELKETRPSQTSLQISSNSNVLTFRMPQDNNGDGTILDVNGNIEWSANITYARNGANQITRTDAVGTTTLANNITNLLFTRPASPTNIVQIDITANKTTNLRRQVQDTGWLQIEMRN